MVVGILDNDSYRTVQIAQTSYILALRDLARMDHISVACLLRISKAEAQRLAKTPIHTLERALHSSPPVLTLKGQESTFRGISPMSALLDSLDKGDDVFRNTVAHINAHNGLPIKEPIAQTKQASVAV